MTRAPLLLALLVALGSGEAGPRYDLRLDAGRGLLASGERVRTVTAASGAVHGGGAATLELGSASEGEVAWRGRASLRLSGRSLVAWEAGDGEGEGGGGPALVLQVPRARVLELEARTALRVELHGGWELEVRGAALRIAAEPGGGWLLAHHGGRDVRVCPPSDRGGGTLSLGAGDRLHLGRAAGVEDP